jgi:hypothetical protein
MRLARAIEAAPGADLAPQSPSPRSRTRRWESCGRSRSVGEIGDVAFLEAVELEAAAKRLQLAEDPLEQRRLACGVRSDDGEKLAFGDLAGDVVHGRMAVIAEREIAEGDGGLWARAT